MIRTLKTTLLLASALLVTLPAEALERPWLSGTAATLPAGRVEMGLFQPLRIGVSDMLEIDVPPLIALVAPQVTARLGWTDCWATEITVGYPTPLLNLLSREGTGGIFPADTEVPNILTITATGLFTMKPHRHHWITLAGTVYTAGVSGESTLPILELPLLYPRTAAWEYGAVFRVGIDIDGILWRRWTYNVDADLFVIPDSDVWSHIEQSTTIGCLEAGYKLSWGEYPFGDALHIFPIFDAVFRLRNEG